MISGIYIIKNIINNKVYIGSSSNLKQRLRQHRSFLKLNQHCNKHLQASYNKYGIENFIFNILEITKDIEDREIFYINQFQANGRNFGYNKRLTPNSNNGRIVNEQGRLNMSKGQKGKKYKPEDIKKRSETQSKIVLMFDLNLNLIKTFNSFKETSAFLNIHYSNISKAISKNKICKNHYWKSISKFDLIAGNCNKELCELLGSLRLELIKKYSLNRVISSQALQECNEGSTTNVDDPERIMKQHERTTSFVKDDDIV